MPDFVIALLEEGIKPAAMATPWSMPLLLILTLMPLRKAIAAGLLLCIAEEEANLAAARMLAAIHPRHPAVLLMDHVQHPLRPAGLLPTAQITAVTLVKEQVPLVAAAVVPTPEIIVSIAREANAIAGIPITPALVPGSTAPV